jgi:hypothetical protein
LASSWQSFKSQYRSHLDFPIYRPPIAWILVAARR